MVDEPTTSAPVAGPDPGDGDGDADDAARRKRTLLWVVGGLLVALVAVAVVLLLTKTSEKVVPETVGQDLAAATQILEDDGFKVEVRRTTNVAAPDRVLSQDPSGGSKADDGATIKLTVSSGPGDGTVPNVAGLSEPDATQALQQAGFKVRTDEQYSSSVAQGTAIRTDPASGASLERTETVTLIVSRGPQHVQVPDVVGDTQAAATKALQQAGLSSEVIEARSNQSPGDVLSQTPTSGTQVTLGSTVRIVVDKAPSNVQVPNVVGQTQQQASTTLSGLGLAVFYKTKVVDEQSQDGDVLAQDPAAGAKVQPGSRVTLQVGQYQPTPPPNPPPLTVTTSAAPTAATP